VATIIRNPQPIRPITESLYNSASKGCCRINGSACSKSACGPKPRRSNKKVFRGLKDGDWLGWGPMYHWTDSKIRVHAFYCMLGISLLNYIHAQARRACPRITVEQMKTELEGIYEFALLYPPQGDKGPYRTATVQSKQTLTQQILSEALGLLTLTPAKMGKTKSRR
jgi:hypothetical protein